MAREREFFYVLWTSSYSVYRMYAGTYQHQEPPVTAAAQRSHRVEPLLQRYLPWAEGGCKAVSSLC